MGQRYRKLAGKYTEPEQRYEEEDQKGKENKDPNNDEQPNPGHKWNRDSDIKENAKLNDAPAPDKKDQDGEELRTSGPREKPKTNHQKLRENHVKDIALLRSLQHDKNYTRNLQ